MRWQRPEQLLANRIEFPRRSRSAPSAAIVAINRCGAMGYDDVARVTIWYPARVRHADRIRASIEPKFHRPFSVDTMDRSQLVRYAVTAIGAAFVLTAGLYLVLRLLMIEL